SQYIMSVESYYHGLRPLSIIYVIPHTLAIYSAIFSACVLMAQAWQRVHNTLQFLSSFASFSAAVLPILATLAYFDSNLFSLLSTVFMAIQYPKVLSKMLRRRLIKNVIKNKKGP
ncbi:hypothetical protein FRB97_004018, partial [Tulasnella sp. 331]